MTDFIVELPHDIVVAIFVALPSKAVAACKCVCRSWRALILYQYFAELWKQRPHTTYMVWSPSYLFCRKARIYSLVDLQDGDGSASVVDMTKQLEFPGFDGGWDIVDSVNGLLCLQGFGTFNPVYVSNPMTGEYIVLPETNFRRWYLTNGFGYSPKTKQYKVVRTFYNLSLIGEIHTVGTKTWRRISNMPYRLYNGKSGFYLSGALHWVVNDNNALEIYSLDIDKEQFQQFPGPPVRSNLRKFTSAGVLAGKRYTCFRDPSNSGGIDIWVMRHYAVKESWSEICVINNQREGWWRLGGPLQIIRICENGKILMKGSSIDLVSYNFRDRSLTKVDADVPLVYLVAHVPSFSQLKDAIHGGNLRVLKVQVINLEVRSVIVCRSAFTWYRTNAFCASCLVTLQGYAEFNNISFLLYNF